jgi:uncharacterized protein
MNISENSSDNTNIITSYDNDYITILDKKYTKTLYACKNKVDSLKITDILELNNTNLKTLINHGPEIVIFGTGTIMKQPNSETIKTLIEKKINFEYMNTKSAIKTYNALCFDERNVLGLFIL